MRPARRGGGGSRNNGDDDGSGARSSAERGGGFGGGSGDVDDDDEPQARAGDSFSSAATATASTSFVPDSSASASSAVDPDAVFSRRRSRCRSLCVRASLLHNNIGCDLHRLHSDLEGAVRHYKKSLQMRLRAMRFEDGEEEGKKEEEEEEEGETDVGVDRDDGEPGNANSASGSGSGPEGRGDDHPEEMQRDNVNNEDAPIFRPTEDEADALESYAALLEGRREELRQEERDRRRSRRRGRQRRSSSPTGGGVGGGSSDGPHEPRQSQHAAAARGGGDYDSDGSDFNYEIDPYLRVPNDFHHGMTYYYDQIYVQEGDNDDNTGGDGDDQRDDITAAAATLLNLSTAEYQSGNRSAAGKLLRLAVREALKLEDDILPSASSRQPGDVRIVAHNNAAYISFEEGDYSAAVMGFEHALELVSRRRRRCQPQQTQDRGRHDRKMAARDSSARHQRRQSERRRQGEGEDQDRDRISSVEQRLLLNLAWAALRLREFDRASDLCRRASDLCRRQRLRDVPPLPSSAASQYVRADDVDDDDDEGGAIAIAIAVFEAEMHRRHRLLDDATRIYDSILEAHRPHLLRHPDISAAVLHNRGMTHLSRGNPAKAKLSLLRALSIRRSLYGLRHKSVADVLGSIGRVLYAQDELRDALSVHQRALCVQISLLPLGHPHMVDTMCRVGMIHYTRGELQESLDLYERVCEFSRMGLFDDRAIVTGALKAIGMILCELGRVREAMRVFVELAQYTEGSAAVFHFSGSCSILCLHRGLAEDSAAAAA